MRIASNRELARQLRVSETAIRKAEKGLIPTGELAKVAGGPELDFTARPPSLRVSATTTSSSCRQHRRPRRRRGRDPHAWAGLPSYPRHPSGVPCPLPRWTAAGASVGCFPAACSLPRNSGGSASTTSLSRPAQASLALRPAGLLNRPRRPLSRGFDPSGRPGRPLVSYQINRQLSGWNLPPLATRAIWAH